MVLYDGNVTPDHEGWTVIQIVCGPQLSLNEGWFNQHVELCPGYSPPGGQSAIYGRSLEDFDGAGSFFVDWRTQTTAPVSELIWGGGVDLSLGSFGNTNYHFRIARDQAQLNRDNLLPMPHIDIEPDVPHSYRLELYGAQQYIWYIDGRVVDAGVPEGTYPSYTPRVNWRAKAAWVANTSRLDYIRYGTLVPAERGDVNCDGHIDNFDIDPFIQVLIDPVGYQAAHPGCSLISADANGDGRTNNFDIDAFIALLAGD